MRPIALMAGALGLMALTITVARAQDDAPAPTPTRPMHMSVEERFARANVTHDGRLTLDQARAAHEVKVVNHFNQLDPTHRGYVTIDDIRAGIARLHHAPASGEPAQ